MIIKDPKFSRFVPLTVAALHEIDVEPKFIISLRNPLEVADSLKTRDGLPLLKNSFFGSITLCLQSGQHAAFRVLSCITTTS